MWCRKISEKMLEDAYRDFYRKQVANRIEKLHKSAPRNNTHPEIRTVKSIQSKLKNNEAMIAPADKGNSLVILPIHQYESKIQDFIDTNNFSTSTSNPTKIFQSQVRKTINHSPHLIPPNSKWKLINLNLNPFILVYERLRWSRGSVLAFSTQVRGFKPGRSRRIFKGEKNPQHAFLRRGSKAIGPMS